MKTWRPWPTAYSTKLRPGPQVQEVEAADRRRHDHQRPLPHARRRRRVLDDLDDVVAVDDRARADPEVLADGEGAAVDLGGHPAVVPDVVEHVAEASDDAAPAGVEGALQRRGVAEQRVGGRQRADVRVEDEARLLHLAPVRAAALVVVDEAAQRIRPAPGRTARAAGIPGSATRRGRRTACPSARGRSRRCREGCARVSRPSRATSRARGLGRAKVATSPRTTPRGVGRATGSPPSTEASASDSFCGAGSFAVCPRDSSAVWLGPVVVVSTPTPCDLRHWTGGTVTPDAGPVRSRGRELGPAPPSSTRSPREDAPLP